MLAVLFQIEASSSFRLINPVRYIRIQSLPKFDIFQGSNSNSEFVGIRHS